MHRLRSLVWLFLSLSLAPLAAQEYEPKLTAAAKEARTALKKFRGPADLEVTLFAAEPMLANPVAFCFDTRGRLFIAETFRLHRGVTDNRDHKKWMDEELACRTVADRMAMYERKFEKDVQDWRSEHERIRMLEDTDGDAFLASLKRAKKKRQASPLTGEWRAWLDCPGGALPFALHFETSGDRLEVQIGNGVERIPIPVTRFDGKTLTLDIDYYDSRITARLSKGRHLDGRWTKRRGASKRVDMAFHARPAATNSEGGQRVAADADKAAFDGRWKVQFASDKHPAVGIFRQGTDHKLTGTFLTTLGDYRYLGGIWRRNKMQLSCFDGAHAFLFKAQLDGSGMLRGDFWSSDTWHDTWTATRNESAHLPDPWKLTTATDPDLRGLRFPDLTGQLRSLDDPTFQGKARLLVVFGSWCPNCRDATRYLTELDRRYRGRGLSIVGLAFELTGDKRRDTAQLEIYAKRQGIRYPILLAGISDKAEATKTLSILDRVRSYPTTLFLHADGRVRAVHTGFAGPGTGKEHDHLRHRFEKIIEELLAEQRGR